MENWVRARQRSSNNDWNTPKMIWDLLLENKLITKDKNFWETMYDDVVVIDNPPYKINSIVKLKYKIMLRLIENKKPFMLLFPSTTIQTKYFKKLVDEYGNFQVVIPKEKYDFVKSDGTGGKCLFYTLWICWNMKLPNDFNII
jgi:hypothetical protein